MGTSKNFAIETSPAYANLQAHKIQNNKKKKTPSNQVQKMQCKVLSIYDQEDNMSTVGLFKHSMGKVFGEVLIKWSSVCKHITFDSKNQRLKRLQ